jgi:endonuclease-3
MTVEEIKEIIRPCGLSPMKSKGIHGLSHILIDKHGGEVPQSFEYLEELPAVGHKTASVVMSQAFSSRFPVDTHIHRLMYRWNLTNGKNVVQTEKMRNVFSQKRYGMICTYKLSGTEGIFTCSRLGFRKDIITHTIGKISLDNTKK